MDANAHPIRDQWYVPLVDPCKTKGEDALFQEPLVFFFFFFFESVVDRNHWYQFVSR